MVRATSRASLQIAVATLIVTAAAAHASAAELHALDFGREGLAPNRCAAGHAPNPDALPGSEDPAALMRALRQHGLAGAGPALRGRGTGGGSLVRGAGQGVPPCAAPGAMLFGGAPFNRISNRD